jgi:23S rRNA (pseudouridine1915-N3)-methyltransferase
MVIKLKINIIVVGKIKEKYMRQGIDDFKKRISRYSKLDIVEVADEKIPNNASKSDEIQVKESEGEKIFGKIKKDSYVIALDISGKTYSSEKMAGKINKLALEGKSDITFIIGGSLGLSNKVLDRADEGMSFGKMTFPHQLMRLILLEQIFRSFKIIKGETYHK